MTRGTGKDKASAGFETTEFDTLANSLLKEFHVPGLSIAIVEGEEIKAKGFGLAEVDSGIPASPETLYYIGSITKSFVATSFVKYVASQQNQERKQKIALETPLTSIIPGDFVLPDDWATHHITFEDAFSHRTGSASHDYTYGGSLNSQKLVTRNLRNLPLSSDPRTKYEYCNNMYVAASHALESFIGDPIQTIVRRQILDPLRMNSTYATKSEAREKGHGKTQLYDGYSWVGGDAADAKGRFSRREHTDLSKIAGAGYIISNVLDMAKYAKAWLGQHPALSPEVREQVTRPLIIDSKMPFTNSYRHYGLGLSSRNYRGVEVISHNGGLTGYTSMFAFIPSKQWAFIGLGNSDWAQCAEEVLLFHLVDNLLGIEASDRYDYVKYNHDYLRKFITRDPDAVKKHFPSAPSPGLPATLSIEKYTGTFSNIGYRSITFELVQRNKSGSTSAKQQMFLQASVSDCTWPYLLQLFHVSGEYWVAYQLRGLEEFEGQQIGDFKALSRVGVNGMVEAWGLMIEPSLDKKSPEGRWEDGLIWFDRI